MTRILLSSVAAAAVLASAPAAWAQTEIQFWHAMGGNLGETVNELAAGFNKSQSEYKVVPVYKGSYTETLTAATHQHPLNAVARNGPVASKSKYPVSHRATAYARRAMVAAVANVTAYRRAMRLA